MKKSIYQFSEPRLCKLEFDLCNDFVLRENTECNIQLKLETKIQKKDADEAVVLLQVLLEGDAPYKIIAEESANFKWDMGEVDESDVEKFLQQNAPTLLLGYIRQIISTVTAASGYGAYNIPFINFIQ